MNRSEIVVRLSELYPKMNRRSVDKLVKILFTMIVSNIAEGRRIEIRGFGCFSLKMRKPGKVRNPRDGISMEAGSRHVVYFRPGKELKTRVHDLDNIMN